MRDTDYQRAAWTAYEDELWERLSFEPTYEDIQRVAWSYLRPLRIAETVRAMLEGANENGPIK